MPPHLFLAKITSISCFHICIPAHGVISFLTWQSDMREKRSAESSEADYQTASSADLSDRGMLFWLRGSTLHNQCVLGCVGVVGRVWVWEQWHSSLASERHLTCLLKTMALLLPGCVAEEFIVTWVWNQVWITHPFLSFWLSSKSSLQGHCCCVPFQGHRDAGGQLVYRLWPSVSHIQCAVVKCLMENWAMLINKVGKYRMTTLYLSGIWVVISYWCQSTIMCSSEKRVKILLCLLF